MVALKVPLDKSPAMYRGPGTAGWTQYQSCLEQNLSVSPQQSAQIVPILANEGRKVMAIRNNNSLSNVQKTQGVKTLQKQSDPQLKAILSSARIGDRDAVVRRIPFSYCLLVNRHPTRSGQHFGIYKHLTVRFAVAKTCPIEHFHREAIRAFAQIGFPVR
jgi:hypothetical protein